MPFSFKTISKPRYMGLTFCKSAIGFFGTLLLMSCDTPERLPADVSIESSKNLVKESLIAPIKGIDDEEFPIAEALPRRLLLQVQHAPSSLSNSSFVKHVYGRLQDTVEEEDDDENMVATSDGILMIQDDGALSDAEKNNILSERMEKRAADLVGRGLELEKRLFEDIRVVKTEVEALMKTTVAGLSDPMPVFGRNLTADRDGYLSIPSDIVFVGGENGTFASKTASIRNQLNNPVISFSARQMPIADALNFLMQSINLQATMSDAVLNSNQTVTIAIEASVLAILDALMQQNDLAIIYDADIEVAQIYTDTELTNRLATIRTSIEGYNKQLFDKRTLERADQDQERLRQMIGLSQLLLGADDESFIRGVETISRAPAGEIASLALADLTQEARKIRKTMMQFDRRTNDLLTPEKHNIQHGSNGALLALASKQNMLIENPCIVPSREVFVEKINIYNAPITGSAGVIKRIDDFFAMTRDADNSTSTNSATASPASPASPTTTPASASVTATSSSILDNDLACPDGDPAPRKPTMLADDTGMIISGTRRDNDLLVKLVEQFDVPNLQVLIEIFMITVSQDFSRQIDSLLNANPSAGGNGVSEATLAGVSDGVAAAASSFNLNLSSPNQELTSLINFLESNKLARLVSSPTILVADGETAEISRVQKARVSRIEQSAGDNGTVLTNTVIDEFLAPFQLDIGKVKINRINKTVQLEVRLEDTRFASALSSVTNETDETTDTITTKFWSAPGDVIVLAGLTRNSETTNTTGLPGMTGELGAIAPALGGTDGIENTLSETIIFMAPTVIDPSADQQPHSAFRTRNRRKTN